MKTRFQKVKASPDTIKEKKGLDPKIYLHSFVMEETVSFANKDLHLYIFVHV